MTHFQYIRINDIFSRRKPMRKIIQSKLWRHFEPIVQKKVTKPLNKP